jgi:hydroxymethylglutaryl-CoA lyase
MTLPARVTIVEVGPRDGLQNEAADIPTKVKLGFVDRLTDAGLGVIEATSFVHPRAVPQLADADDLLPAIRHAPGVRYPVLVPTPRGLERALAAGAEEVAVVIGATDAFNRANLNRTVDGALADAALVIGEARSGGLRTRGYVSVAFGCPYDGPVAPATTASVAARLIEIGCDEISLGDTIGAATPGDIGRVLDAVLPRIHPDRVGLHAHDTRGQALANVYAALERGITILDSSAGGLGGCPFAGPGAVGNLATEDLVYFLDGLGIEHGTSLEGVMAASAFIEAAVGHPLRSRTYQAGGRPRTRPLPGAGAGSTA